MKLATIPFNQRGFHRATLLSRQCLEMVCYLGPLVELAPIGSDGPQHTLWKATRTYPSHLHETKLHFFETKIMS